MHYRRSVFRAWWLNGRYNCLMAILAKEHGLRDLNTVRTHAHVRTLKAEARGCVRRVIAAVIAGSSTRPADIGAHDFRQKPTGVGGACAWNCRRRAALSATPPPLLFAVAVCAAGS